VFRPDDVWQAILTQLSFYIQANAEELRNSFVDFDGKKQLTVYSCGTLFTADFGNMAEKMVDSQIARNLKDPSVSEWLLPSFSTTTSNDRVVASVSVMATLQAYFEYRFCLCCGIPRVTLLGTPCDWRALRTKIDRLPQYDLDKKLMSAWHQLLAPVLDEFVRASEGQPDLAFWDRVCHRRRGGSGPEYLCGWVTAFAVFSSKGEWRGHRTDGGWPKIDSKDLPVASVSVPVLVDDNGVEYHTQMLAGQFGFDVLDSGTSVQPRSDWCIAVPKSAVFCSSAAGPQETVPLLEDEMSRKMEALAFCSSAAGPQEAIPLLEHEE
jgi:hypothetical protein